MATAEAEVTPFVVEWDEDRLRELRHQVDVYGWPEVSPAWGWRYGCDLDFLRDLCRYWVDGYDEIAAARELNHFPQGIASADGCDLHFVHVVGEAEGRRPLLLSSGWPGSFYEYWSVIEPLAFPSRHGGVAEEAFDIVVPSLPGFGFSRRPSGTTGPRATARLFDILMREVLRYPRYLAQGSDWGAGVTAWIALDHPASVDAIHLDYLLTRPDAEPETAAERDWKADYDARQAEFGAYSLLQETKPASLAYAMAMNPVGQLAWIVERFHDWADLRERLFEQVFTKDQLLTNAMLYILTGAFDTAAFYYADAEAENARFMPRGRRVTVPTAFSGYPSPAFPSPPREWVERCYDLTHFKNMPRGGHFPAMEVPELFVDDLRSWGRTVSG
jgi:pimeloyl-ACP methyl ester carboxylesterase